MKNFKIVIFGCIIWFGVLLSCSSDDGMAELEMQYEALVALSESVRCENSEDWRVAGIGAKACGGPTGFIAYSVQIDTADFLNKLEAYNEALRNFKAREDDDLVSNCMVISPPSAILCEEGKPVLIY